MLRPTPWPTRLRTTPKPRASTTSCTAWLTSPSRFPSRHWSIAAFRPRLHASIRSAASGVGSPIVTVIAESATYPSSVTPTSIESRSPSDSGYGPGMPCTTIAFGDAQIDPGKPR